MPRKSPAKKPARRKRTSPQPYSLTLRTPGAVISFVTTDKYLYPIAVGWNRLLNADRERMSDQDWREAAEKAVLKLIEEADISLAKAQAFLTAAAQAGVIQVEIPWISEGTGYAARVFPWEAMLALATKRERDLLEREMAVFRLLKRKTPVQITAIGQPLCVVAQKPGSASAEVSVEMRVIDAVLTGQQPVVRSRDWDMLKKRLADQKPRLVHCVFADQQDADESRGPKKERQQIHVVENEQIAQTLAAHHPALAVFSAPHSGRRLAALAVAAGASMALGFHDSRDETCAAAFFGGFYEAWGRGEDILDCLQNGLRANGCMPRPRDLGVVTLWSDRDLLSLAQRVRPKVALKDEKKEVPVISAQDAEKALVVICKPVAALNYAMLSNQRGGLFSDFQLFKSKPGRMPPLQVRITLETGDDRPVECRFHVSLPEEGGRPVPLMECVVVPLGGRSLRRRGESLAGTLEVSIQCGEAHVFHHFGPMLVPPCDEWLDNAAGRRYLPCFVLPRDPAVREVLSAAQPFLNAIADHATAGFDGYQGGSAPEVQDAVNFQVRAIWSALQLTFRIAYAEPPPGYAEAQRIRVPEEVLRARRGTCIELALLLCACLEHAGIHPVLFLTTGHCFAGFWATDEARLEFQKLPNLLKHASKVDARSLGGGQTSNTVPWFLTARQHLPMIRDQVEQGALIPLEATYVAQMQPFHSAVDAAKDILMNLKNSGEGFDGMLELRTARDKGVQPLAILTEGVAA
jgi:hypothetical protein